MKHITSIADYCKEININAPLYSFFDIRKFEDNMKTVNLKQPPFRHEFYCIAFRQEGTNKEVLGNPLKANLFFNSPYQIITWDIIADWKGWYIIFDREFISLNPSWTNFIIDYCFFRLDKYIAFDLPEEASAEVNNYFRLIFQEYHSDNEDKFQFIKGYTHMLLNITKRYFERLKFDNITIENNLTSDILLLSRFRILIETFSINGESNAEVRQPSFYADKLNIHPNYLNAVVKRLTDRTATQIIQQYLIIFSKSLLKQTQLSIKEIAYRLHFIEPTHFIAFYKKQTNYTPQQYRELADI